MPDAFKALSIWQPWASAIALGAKTIETRHWQTAYRGTLLIHAAKTRAGYGDAAANDFRDFVDIAPWAKLPHGAIIAVAELVGCPQIDESWSNLLRTKIVYSDQPRGLGSRSLGTQELALGDYAAGRYGWLLSNVRKLREPIPYRGMQGLFSVPREALPAEALAVIEGAGDA